MKTITANLPSRTFKGVIYPAYTTTFTGDTGNWSHEFGRILEDDVIDVCKKASNWSQIKAEFFPMDGFSS